MLLSRIASASAIPIFERCHEPYVQFVFAGRDNSQWWQPVWRYQHFDKFGFGIDITAAADNDGLRNGFPALVKRSCDSGMGYPNQTFLPHCGDGGRTIIK